MFSILKIIILGLTLSSAAWADDWDRHRHGHHHGHHHREYLPYYRRDIVYLPAAPVVEYVPVAPRYYAPPPVRYYRYDQRSPTGLVGSIVGGAVGYQVGGGDPLAAGIGAAAGAMIGNGRY